MTVDSDYMLKVWNLISGEIESTVLIKKEKNYQLKSFDKAKAND